MAYTEFNTEELLAEEWRPIPGYEDIYSVSNLGRIRRERPGRNTYKGRILEPTPDRQGYLTTVLNGRRPVRRLKVHSLVALAFIGQRPEGYVVNHIDGVKTNNRPQNLEYCTGAENMRHAAEHGLMSCGKRHSDFTRPHTPRGERNHKAKLNAQQVKEIRETYATGQYSTYALAREYNLARSTIGRLVTHVTWAHV